MKKADYEATRALQTNYGDRCRLWSMNYGKGCKVQVMFNSARVTRLYGEFTKERDNALVELEQWEATVPATGRTRLGAIGYGPTPETALLDARVRIETNIADLKLALWQTLEALKVAYPDYILPDKEHVLSDPYNTDGDYLIEK